MATDYDAPRKTEDDSESIEALKERVPDKLSGSVDVEDADNPSGFELPGADLSDLELDVVVLPQQPARDIFEGNPEKNDYQEPYPPEYVGGLGQLGADALAEFAEAGGTLVALDSACGFVLRYLHPPVRDVVDGLSEEEFYCPGSLLRVVVDTSHPLGWGMKRQEVALFMKSPVFEGTLDDHVAVVARYPEYEPNLSGWILGANRLAGKGALAEVALGDGRVVLIGFRPQFRAQARGSYRFLFNAIARGAQGAETPLSLG